MLRIFKCILCRAAHTSSRARAPRRSSLADNLTAARGTTRIGSRLSQNYCSTPPTPTYPSSERASRRINISVDHGGVIFNYRVVVRPTAPDIVPPSDSKRCIRLVYPPYRVLEKHAGVRGFTDRPRPNCRSLFCLTTALPGRTTSLRGPWEESSWCCSHVFLSNGASLAWWLDANKAPVHAFHGSQMDGWKAEFCVRDSEHCMCCGVRSPITRSTRQYRTLPVSLLPVLSHGKPEIYWKPLHFCL